MNAGRLVLVGGGEWSAGCDFDAELLAESGADEVVVLPTGSAYEHPERLVAAASDWFGALGVKVRGLDVLRRPDALDPGNAEIVRGAQFVYLAGTSPMHLRSVLKDSAVWEGLVSAWHDGAVLAGSAAGAMVLCDPMVDPRGGAFTLGLGLVENVTVVPHFDTWSHDKAQRTLQLAPKGLIIVGVHERTAVIREPDGAWRAAGAGTVTVWRDGEDIGLDQLP